MVALYTEIFIFGFFLWLSLMIFMHPLKKREEYKVYEKLLGVGYFVIFVVYLCFFLQISEAVYFLSFILLCYLSISVHVCAKINIKASLYVAMWSLISSQFIYQIWKLTVNYIFSERYTWLTSLVFLAIGYIAIDFVLWQTISKKMPEDGNYQIGPRQLSSAIAVFLLFEFLFFQIILSDMNEKVSILLLPAILSQMYGIFTLYIQTELFKKSAMEHELTTMNLLWQQHKLQYDLNKENIDLINRKCHDFKHQISAIRTMGASANIEQYLKEVENSILIYDAIVKTGNEVLDTILTEKSLYCEANGIRIHYVVDGKKMDFMDPIDLYSILGNAIDNAIEGVKKVNNPDLQLIDIAIYTKESFLVMTISNPIQEKISFHDGIPVSTKPNNGYHGYGIKSIKHYVSKYDGHISISIENNCFIIKMLLPIKNEK